jgi:hypothetical protein
MSEIKQYTSHSGGCKGADMFWETEGLKYGVASIAYSYHNHVQYGYNQKILNADELKEGWENVMIAEKSLRRDLRITQSFYVRNLVSRNWFQVKNSETVFAISTFLNNAHTQVNGGTGWAVQMGIDNNKPVFFFDQLICKWFEYDYTQRKFVDFDGIPTLTHNFAGVGSANLNEDGEDAIREIYKFNFKDE